MTYVYFQHKELDIFITLNSVRRNCWRLTERHINLFDFRYRFSVAAQLRFSLGTHKSWPLSNPFHRTKNICFPFTSLCASKLSTSNSSLSSAVELRALALLTTHFRFCTSNWCFRCSFCFSSSVIRSSFSVQSEHGRRSLTVSNSQNSSPFAGSDFITKLYSRATAIWVWFASIEAKVWKTIKYSG